MSGASSSSSNRFYTGLNTGRRLNPIRPQPQDVLQLLEEQKKVSKALQEQNTGLLLLTAKIGKELQQLRKETSEIQQNASELIKKQVEAQISVQTGKENCGSKRKSKLPLALTRKVRSLHSNQEPENQYRGMERFSSQHNQQVAGILIAQLAEHTSDFSEEDIRRAVHRHYESKRRMVLDALPARRSQVIANKAHAKRQSFRTRLYRRRLKAVCSEEERAAWLELSPAYMTEESETEEGVVTQHQLTWTSERLQELKSVLDQRIESSNTISGRFLSKPRTDGPPSTVTPPYNPIQWAIMSPPENEIVVETHECTNGAISNGEDCNLIDVETDSLDDTIRTVLESSGLTPDASTPSRSNNRSVLNTSTPNRYRCLSVEDTSVLNRIMGTPIRN